MFAWLRRLLVKKPRDPQSTLDLTSPELRIHREYWTRNDEEKAFLLARYPDSLSWSETLRLHHLNCLEIVSESKAQFVAAHTTAEPAETTGPAFELCKELSKKLLSRESPYRPRHCAVWQGQPGESDKREADIQGEFSNASITHLGCLEVIRIDSNQQPTELAFIPLDEIRGALFAERALFRAGKLFYDDGREDEMVSAPLIYGISWDSPNTYDRDGTMTRFCCHIHSEGIGAASGIGIGHQDFTVPKEDGSATLFGLGSVGEIMVALAMDDSKFEQKCKTRGLDPEDIRRQMTEQGGN